MQSISSDSQTLNNGLRVESFFNTASENYETDTDSDSGAFTAAHRRRKSNNDDAHRLSTPEMIRHAFNIAVIKVSFTLSNRAVNSETQRTMKIPNHSNAIVIRQKIISRVLFLDRVHSSSNFLYL